MLQWNLIFSAIFKISSESHEFVTLEFSRNEKCETCVLRMRVNFKSLQSSLRLKSHTFRSNFQVSHLVHTSQKSILPNHLIRLSSKFESVNLFNKCDSSLISSDSEIFKILRNPLIMISNEGLDKSRSPLILTTERTWGSQTWMVKNP